VVGRRRLPLCIHARGMPTLLRGRRIWPGL
jgi:hypothetical protein